MKKTSLPSRLTEHLLPTLSVIVFVGAWQLFVDLKGIQPIYLPSPVAIFRALIRMCLDGTMEYNLGLTLLRILAGFMIATIAGVGFGILMGMSRLLSRISGPWIAALYPLPKISLIPLLIIWLGSGETYKIVISAISAFFPIVMSTYAAVQQVDRGLIKAAQDLGANRHQVQLKVVMPAAIPTIFAGLDIGMGVTIILVVAAEMIGSSGRGGIGSILITAGQIMETEQVFAALVVLAIVGAAIIKLQQWIERLIAPWAVRQGS